MPWPVLTSAPVSFQRLLAARAAQTVIAACSDRLSSLIIPCYSLFQKRGDQ